MTRNAGAARNFKGPPSAPYPQQKKGGRIVSELGSPDWSGCLTQMGGPYGDAQRAPTSCAPKSRATGLCAAPKDAQPSPAIPLTMRVAGWRASPGTPGNVYCRRQFIDKVQFAVEAWAVVVTRRCILDHFAQQGASGHGMVFAQNRCHAS
jgi:hypothetical protein